MLKPRNPPTLMNTGLLIGEDCSLVAQFGERHFFYPDFNARLIPVGTVRVLRPIHDVRTNRIIIVENLLDEIANRISAE